MEFNFDYKVGAQKLKSQPCLLKVYLNDFKIEVDDICIHKDL